ncbi:TetM/TetW/TetO/TetS family tetracycline resistance ribosomal protection protein [Nocardiopsis eucommiae]|uniref:TetM/TetW/TetO/TetS family tetracycline resistance ribosomal protection protein n=1 Tax=Nocardiopsis eucommiae TaxID=2831970 RepID=A0A975QL11_9ACTN|nr:TetM/TetW/TetO/TetS family tetracycline resistance ribosomal protection protein [Nocardiopsis eucommiae]
MTTLNIGILAHVDAGKTSLTERLLFDAGATDRLGGVDTGDTQTDTGRIERERGITVRTAVASFRAGPVQVNLIDTPGHTDFVAEVERALAVLDGAVLVLSAVEGVQPHTRMLMRVLRQMRLPVLLFVNKIDRGAAAPGRVFEEIRHRLTDRALALDSVTDAGSARARVRAHDPDDPGHAARTAEFLAEHDDALLAAVVEDRPLPGPAALRATLRSQVLRGLAHPVLSGSAITGEGVPELTSALTDLLPAHPGPDLVGGDCHGTAREDAAEEPRGTVFAIERSPTGEKTGYLRLYEGALRARDRVRFERAHPADGAPHEGRLTRLEVVGSEGERDRPLTAGGIGRIRGLPGLRVGDRIGRPTHAPPLARPALESVVRPVRPEDANRLHSALAALSDQDPLIRLRTVPGEGLSVLLHGEVQKEVVAATLSEDFRVEAVFAPSDVVHTERPCGSGTAVEPVDLAREIGGPVTVGLRVEPGEDGSGVVFRRETELGALLPAYDRAVEDAVRGALGQGLHGWPVTDCVVTLVRSGYVAPLTEAAHFRHLVPMVTLRALERAGSRVFAPVHAFELSVPATELSAVLSLLGGHGARVRETEAEGDTWRVTGEVGAGEAHTVGAALAGATRGEGAWVSRPAGDRLVRGRPPRRNRTDGNPLDPDAYLVHLNNAGRAGTGG